MNRLHLGLRATLLGLSVNTLLAGGKLAAGFIGHSSALVADGVESLADILSSLVVLRGVVVASEPADEDHPYGHGKAEPIAAAVVAALMLGAVVWIVAAAITGMTSHRHSPQPFTLAVLAAAVFVKEGLFRFVSREAARAQSLAMRADAWHHRTDMITSLAAAIGISVALVGGERLAAADNVAAVVAGAIIARNGWHLLRPAVNELMDRSPGRAVVEQIRRAAQATPGVDAVEKCLVRKMGHRYYVEMHVEVDPEMTVRRSHEIAHQVKDHVCTDVPAVSDVLVHIEPRGQMQARTPWKRGRP